MKIFIIALLVLQAIGMAVGGALIIIYSIGVEGSTVATLVCGVFCMIVNFVFGLLNIHNLRMLEYYKQ